MKLLGTQASPYTRKERLILPEKNIPHAVIVDAPNDDSVRTSFAA